LAADIQASVYAMVVTVFTGQEKAKSVRNAVNY